MKTAGKAASVWAKTFDACQAMIDGTATAEQRAYIYERFPWLLGADAASLARIVEAYRAPRSKPS